MNKTLILFVLFVWNGLTAFGNCSDIAVEIDNTIDLYDLVRQEHDRRDPEPAFYYHSDHLGSAAYLTSGGDVTQTLNYLPYGEDWIDVQNNMDPRLGQYRFNGKEKDYESGFHYYGARYYWSEVLTSSLSVDPMADKYSGISPYAYCIWNPVKLVDPDGREISTHIDQDGNVVAVFNDGDNGVYQHKRNADESSVTEYQLSKRAEKYGSSCGGVRIGETEYWDEFVSPETGKTMTNYKLQIGKSFDPIIRDLHSKAMEMDLIDIANNSKGGELFDMKKDYPNVGALLNGKYATSRSAGDFLAGYNAESGSYLGFGVSFKTFQQLAGALHIEESNRKRLSKWQMVDIVLWGYYNSNSNQSNYKPPTWGKVPYQYRRSLEGWNYGSTH